MSKFVASLLTAVLPLAQGRPFWRRTTQKPQIATQDSADSRRIYVSGSYDYKPEKGKKFRCYVLQDVESKIEILTRFDKFYKFAWQEKYKEFRAKAPRKNIFNSAEKRAAKFQVWLDTVQRKSDASSFSEFLFALKKDVDMDQATRIKMLEQRVQHVIENKIQSHIVFRQLSIHNFVQFRQKRKALYNSIGAHLGLQVSRKRAQTQQGSSKPAQTQQVSSKPAQAQQGSSKPAQTQQGSSKPAQTQQGSSKPAQAQQGSKKRTRSYLYPEEVLIVDSVLLRHLAEKEGLNSRVTSASYEALMSLNEWDQQIYTENQKMSNFCPVAVADKMQETLNHLRSKYGANLAKSVIDEYRDAIDKVKRRTAYTLPERVEDICKVKEHVDYRFVLKLLQQQYSKFAYPLSRLEFEVVKQLLVEFEAELVVEAVEKAKREVEKKNAQENHRKKAQIFTLDFSAKQDGSQLNTYKQGEAVLAGNDKADMVRMHILATRNYISMVQSIKPKFARDPSAFAKFLAAEAKPLAKKYARLTQRLVKKYARLTLEREGKENKIQNLHELKQYYAERKPSKAVAQFEQERKQFRTELLHRSRKIPLYETILKQFYHRIHLQNKPVSEDAEPIKEGRLQSRESVNEALEPSSQEKVSKSIPCFTDVEDFWLKNIETKSKSNPLRSITVN